MSNFVCVHRNGSGVAKRSNICTAPHERAARSEDGDGDGDGGGDGGGDGDGDGDGDGGGDGGGGDG